MPATFESSNGVHPGLKNGMNLENALKIVSLHLPSIPAPKNAGASLSTLRLCDFATLRYIRGTQRREGARAQRLETTESIRIRDFRLCLFWLPWILSILLTADARRCRIIKSAFIGGSLYFQLTGRALQNRHRAAE